MDPFLNSFPSFLLPAFDAEELEQRESTVAVLDASLRILWVNRAWSVFAKNNGARALDVPPSYLDGISPSLRDFYRTALETALITGEVFEQDYECSSPNKKDYFIFASYPSKATGFCWSTA